MWLGWTECNPIQAALRALIAFSLKMELLTDIYHHKTASDTCSHMAQCLPGEAKPEQVGWKRKLKSLFLRPLETPIEPVGCCLFDLPALTTDLEVSPWAWQFNLNSAALLIWEENGGGEESEGWGRERGVRKVRNLSSGAHEGSQVHKEGRRV